MSLPCVVCVPWCAGANQLCRLSGVPQESALVKRAMGELKSLRGQIAEKDKQIKADAQKTKKMMQMFKDMKQKHKEELEALKL
jgi:septal ring factor EnvC (AmiA/AmiB activator)